MELNDYQTAAASTAIYGESIDDLLVLRSKEALAVYLGLNYAITKLNGEAGELAEEIGKALRDDHGIITDERREAIIKEAGDALWYIARIASELGITMNEVARQNVDKLQSRKKRLKLHGSGSDR